MHSKNNQLLSTDARTIKAEKYLRRIDRAIARLVELLLEWKVVNRRPEDTSLTQRDMNAQLRSLRELRDRVDPPRTGYKPASEMRNRQNQDSARPSKAGNHDRDGGKPKRHEGRYQSKADGSRQATSDRERGQEQERQTNHKRYRECHSAQGRRTGEQYDGRRRSNRHKPGAYPLRKGWRKSKRFIGDLLQGLAQ